LLKKERIVNLIGAGGVGKTRLAEKVAFEVWPSFPDGVWFVDLSSLRDANLVLPTIASALSIQPQPRIPLEQQMVDFLKAKRLFLVLDNFEQLPPKAGQLVEELIQNTRFIRCLVTSRDASTCPQGKEFWVLPLDTPLPEERPLIDRADSLKLFRARAEELGQTLLEEDLLTVAELCRILDGIPLAIELAAARLTDLSPLEILSCVKERLSLQADESMDIFDPRHRTIQGVLAWSYDLLTEDEQELFARLSVFSGGFLTEAVEEICSGEHVLGNLFTLRVKSLVQTETVQQKKRYFLLESVKQYAAEKLGDGEQIKKAHAEYFCLWAKKQDQKLEGIEQGQVLSEMALELDNFRAAMDFAQAQKEHKLLGELGIALSWFFYMRGFWVEGIHRLRQTEEALRNLPDRALFAQALHGLGRFYQSQGDNNTALNLYTESLQVYENLGDKLGIAKSLGNLGIVEGELGASDKAKQFFSESLQIYQNLEDKLGIARSLNNLGNIARHRGDYDEARQYVTRSLQMFTDLGDKRNIANSLGNLGIIAEGRGAYNEAKQFCSESLQMFKNLGDKRNIAAMLNSLGIIARRQGAYHEAGQFHIRSLQMARELENKMGIAYSLNNLGVIALDQHAYDEARRFHTESLQMRRELGHKRDIAESLNNLGEVAWAQGVYDEARQYTSEGLRSFREVGDKRGMAESLYQFGKLAKVDGDPVQAVLFLIAAIRLHEEMASMDSTEAEAIQETLAEIQGEISPERFEGIKQQVETMSVDEVIELAVP